MTDLAPDLGATASCPRCGAQVQVTEVSGPLVRCPDCGAAVPTGVRAQVTEDLTVDALVRAYGVNGYDASVDLVEDGLRCGACGAVARARTWAVDDRRRGSDAAVATPEHLVAAVRCPACGAAGTAVVHLDDADDRATEVAHALEGGST